MPAYSIRPEVFRLRPGYSRAVVVVRGASNGASPPALVAALRAAEASARAALGDTPVASHPAVACWREAFRAFGARPSEFHASIEALLRRVAKGDPLPSINALVDIGNLVSLEFLLPAGAHPLEGVAEDLWLGAATGGESFLPLGDGAAEAPPTGEIVLCAGREVLTRRWVWRQARGTQTLPRTLELFFNVDVMPPMGREAGERAAARVAALVTEFCGGSASTRWLIESGATLNV